MLSLSTLLLLTLATLTLATPTLTPRQITGQTICETSLGSPERPDVYPATDNLRLETTKEKRCIQTLYSFINADGCTIISHVGEAKISICGPYKANVRCGDAARAVLTIWSDCEWEGRAGGKFEFKDSRVSILLHK